MSESQPSTHEWRRRVLALIAKAESTEFPAEAETLLSSTASGPSRKP